MRGKILWSMLLAIAAAGAAPAQDDVVTRAMRDELGRSMQQLRVPGMEAPYFVAYRVEEVEGLTVAASLGSLTTSRPTRMRLLEVELRVGDYALDNSNYLAWRNFGAGASRMFRHIGQVPLDDDYRGIRRQLWLATDAEYKKALEDLAGKRGALQNRKRPEEVPDFSKEQPYTSHETLTAFQVDVAALERLARQVSAAFREGPELSTSAVEIDVRKLYTRYLNSEGTQFTRWQPLVRLALTAESQALDGVPLADSVELYARSLAELPDEAQLVARARALTARLTQLRQAQRVERYNGPVLFEGDAAAELFAQVFAPALLAVRPPLADNPQIEMMWERFNAQGGSFQERLGGKVLPEFVDVFDDPQLEQVGSARLPVSCKVDDDGVPTRITRLVEKGILKTLLATRTPVPNVLHSSGSRHGFGPAPSNLVLSSDKGVTEEALRQELLRRAKLRGRDYGLVVRRVGRGALGRSLARMAAMFGGGNAGSEVLLEVRKLFADGREEAVRGAEISDLTPAAFRDIVATGNRPVVLSDQFLPKLGSFFSFGVGASVAGGLPVASFVVPSLLFDELTLKPAAGPFPNPPIAQSPLLEP